MKILIVEDDDAISNLIKMTLNIAGYQSVQAFDGLECLQQVEKETFDLILMDVMLPQFDGFELLHKIKRYNTPLDQKALESMSEEERFKAPQIMKKGLITVYWGIPASIEGDNQYNEYYIVYFEKESKKLLGVEAFQYSVDDRIKNINQLSGEK